MIWLNFAVTGILATKVFSPLDGYPIHFPVDRSLIFAPHFLFEMIL